MNNNTTKRENNIELSKIGYKPLTKNQELSWIKKAKLSYYNEVDEETQKNFLNYYFSEFTLHRKQYENIIQEINDIIKKINKEKNLTKIKVLRQELLEKEQQREELLKKYIANSKRYRDSFIGNNQRLVMSIAAKKQGMAPLDELVSEGNIGMIKALKKFDVESGNKFSTYATWWIKQHISRFIMEKQRIIRLPVHREEKIIKIKITIDKLTHELYREPTIEELSKATGFSKQLVEKLLEDERQLNELISINQSVKSEDEEMEIFLGEEDLEFKRIDSDLFIEYFIKAMKKANLSEKEQQVLIMRYGLLDDIPHTLGDIGEVYNLTRERIRQIELKALAKVKTNLNLNDLIITDNNTSVIIGQNNNLENIIAEMLYEENLSTLQISRRLNIPIQKVMKITDNIEKNRQSRIK